MTPADLIVFPVVLVPILLALAVVRCTPKPTR